jgi:hypothetical protein
VADAAPVAVRANSAAPASIMIRIRWSSPRIVDS